MSRVPPTEFDYRGKAEILPAVLKGGTLIAGGLLAFNTLLDKPVIGDALVAYRKTMHKLFKNIGGEHFSDPNSLLKKQSFAWSIRWRERSLAFAV